MPLFAIAVQPGCEAQAAELLSEQAGEQAVILPVSEFQLFSKGALQHSEEPMLPGYVFLEAQDAQAVRKACRRARGLADYRSSGMEDCQLTQSEEGLIAQFAAKGAQAQFSEGSICNGQLSVVSGALAGCENLVGRINHRSKRAYVPVTVGGKPAELQLGLRVTRKGGAAS